MSDIEKSVETAPPLPNDPEKASTTGEVTQEKVGNVVLKHADRNDADEALKVLEGENGEVIELAPEDERKLLRKIDWNIMPMLCIVYGLNYLDKTTVSYASIMGLKTDLHLVGQQYSWIGSMYVFHCGMLLYLTSPII